MQAYGKAVDGAFPVYGGSKMSIAAGKVTVTVCECTVVAGLFPTNSLFSNSSALTRRLVQQLSRTRVASRWPSPIWHRSPQRKAPVSAKARVMSRATNV